METNTYAFQSFAAREGPHLALARLQRSDLSELAQALISPTTWFSLARDLITEAKFVAHFGQMLERQKRGELLTVVARARASGEAVAMSTFQYPSEGFRRVEIGFTWIADRWQRTFVNTELKFLMLAHAFEEMKTNRVEFSVSPANAKSNAAMKRLGATFEGTLRKWRFLSGSAPDDGDRNIYSILDDEWPEIKRRLSERMAR